MSRATIIVISSLLKESSDGFDFVFSSDYMEGYPVLSFLDSEKRGLLSNNYRDIIQIRVGRE